MTLLPFRAFFSPFSKLALGLGFMFSLPTAATQNLIMDANQRIEAAICAHSKNRLAVANDRITQIFGDEGTFESQHEESSGQVFLKPTADNGTKTLALTLVTEQGLTQDVALHPTASSARTVILKNPASKPAPSRPTLSGLPLPFAFGGPDGVAPASQGAGIESVLAALRQAIAIAIAGQPGPYEGDPLSCPAPEGYEVTWQQSFQVGPYLVGVYEVKNTLATEREAIESTFYQPGDLALVLHQRLLPPEGTTRLYVVKPL